MDYSLPGCSVLGILEVKLLEWVAIFSSRGSSLHGVETASFNVSCIGRRVLYH